MRQTFALFVGWIGLIMLAGCVGKGEVIPLQLRPLSVGAEKVVKPNETLRVTISKFEDGRNYRTGLGVRTHIWGGVTYFDVPGGDPADAVTHTLAEYLKAKGWHVVKEGGGEGADVAITGMVQELSVHAKSRIGFTEVTTKSKLTVRATNRTDGSVVHMTLSGSGSEDVFWFDHEDVQAVLNEVLTDSFGKLIQDTTVQNNQLRLKNP